METDYYLDQIVALLDEAAKDKYLSLHDYADLCGEVWTTAQVRCEAAMNDIENSDD